MHERLTRAKREKVERALSALIESAEGHEGGALAAHRAQAMRYYQGRPMGNEIEGRSQVVSTDVADMVNATLAMIVPMLSTDAVVEFEPEGPEDEQAAAAESLAVNALVMEENRGFLEIQEAVKDALLLRNGCMKVEVIEAPRVERVPLPEGLPAEQIAALLEPRSPLEEREREGDHVVIRNARRRFRVEAVPIENMLYTPGWCGLLQEVPFIAEAMELSRSELRARGIPKAEVYGLKAAGRDPGAGRVRDAEHLDGAEGETPDQDMIDCHMAYVLIDLDGDGVSERYRALVANDRHLLELEAVEIVPYVMGSPFLNPHRMTGESLFDHLKATQDVKTALKRNLIDNTLINNNTRFIYDPSRTSEADIMSPVAGGGIRSRDPAGAVVPVPVLDITSGILAAIDYEDRVRTERGGASLSMMQPDAQIVGETAHGIERQYGAREMMASMMARNLSESLIRGTWLLVHAYLRRFANAPVSVVVAGQRQWIDPRLWPERDRVNVTTGLTPGERGHLQMVLGEHVQLQAQAMASGMNGILADPVTMYRTQVARLRLAGVNNPERLVIDPMSPAAQQAAQAQQESQAAAQEAAQIEAETQRSIEYEKIASSDRQHRDEMDLKIAELELKVRELQQKGEIAETDLTIRELERRARNGAGNAGAAAEPQGRLAADRGADR